MNGARTGDLKTVVDEVRDLIISEQEEICIHHEEQKIQLHPAQRIPPLRYLIGIISPVALNLMVDQSKMVTNASTCLELYTNVFFQTMGLPCKHRIQHYMFTPSQPIKPEHCHPQWYLDGTPLQYVDPDPMLLIQEPVKIRRKGRPTNTHDTSTKRNLSQFEIAEEAARKARCEKEIAQGIAKERERQRRLQSARETEGGGETVEPVEPVDALADEQPADEQPADEQGQGRGPGRGQGRGQGRGGERGRGEGGAVPKGVPITASGFGVMQF